MPQTWEQKLNLKLGWHVSLENAPDGMLAALRRDLPGIVIENGSPGKSECAMIFLHSLVDVHSQLLVFFELNTYTPVVWLAYPKQTSGVVTDINRDILWKEIAPMGWHPVRQVALDEVWSALRFMPNKAE